MEIFDDYVHHSSLFCDKFSCMCRSYDQPYTVLEEPFGHMHIFSGELLSKYFGTYVANKINLNMTTMTTFLQLSSVWISCLSYPNILVFSYSALGTSFYIIARLHV